jgi:hypothetical protein
MNEILAPFPGLRPFEKREAGIFFGRHEEVNDMLGRLESRRLLTVIGSSGCGKSSLVRAGLLPALEEGFLFGGGSEWRFAILRPGDQPYGKLAAALCRGLPELKSDGVVKNVEFVEASLSSSEHALTKLIRGLPLRSGTCLLVLVDQFEELFRFRGTSHAENDSGQRGHASAYERRNEINSFVDLLLATVEDQDWGVAGAPSGESSGSMQTEWKCPIFVVLTMRSEFIGNCDAFLGLPEAISKTSFLTPRMKREQIRDAVERPLRIFSAAAVPTLVNRILNDVGSDPDSLPLMQHALLRTWRQAVDRSVALRRNDKEIVELTLADYEKIGGFAKALQIHADEAYLELGRDQKIGKRLQRCTQLLFRLLTRETSERMIVRNPMTVGEIMATAEISEAEVMHVAKVFSQEGRNFITISPTRRKVNLDSVLDISHESLFRNWGFLQQWVKDETKSVEDYSWVMQAARHWKERGALFSGPNLRYALAWEQKERPSAKWSARYGGNFALMKDFLKESQRIDRLRRLLFAALPVILILLGAGFFLKYKANGLKAQASAAGASRVLLQLANGYYTNKRDPRRNVLALSTVSQAIASDGGNLDAVKLACNLILSRRWCPPLTQPLHYPESDFISATLVQEGDQSYIFAVSHNGWLLKFNETSTEAEVVTSLVDGKEHGNLAILAAAFSRDGRELMDIQGSQSPGGFQVRSWLRQGLRFVPQGKVPIEEYAPFNVMTWSNDDRVLVYLPVKFDQPSLCQAFRVDGNATTRIGNPFGEVPVSCLAFSREDLVATAKGETLRLWKWTGESFQTLNSLWKDGLTFPDHFRPYSMTFGPGAAHVTLSGPDPTGLSATRVTIVNIEDKSVENVTPPRLRAAFIQLAFQPNDPYRVALSTYRAVYIGDIRSVNLETPFIEPICFQGTFGVPSFSLDGQKVLTLSGDAWPLFDSIQLWDVSLRRSPNPDPNFEPHGQAAPPWLSDLGRAISGGMGPGEGSHASFLTKNQVWEKFNKEKSNAIYDVVWREMFANRF